MLKHTIIDDMSFTLNADKTYFEPTCILEFSSEISSNFFIQTDDGNDCTTIHFTSKSGAINEDMVERLSQSLIDHQVRLNLQKENGHIRDMIVEQAFSSTRK